MRPLAGMTKVCDAHSLSVRVRNALLRKGLYYIRDVRRIYVLDPSSLLRISGIGDAGKKEIEEIVLPEPDDERWEIAVRSLEAIDFEIEAAKYRLRRLRLERRASEEGEIERRLLEATEEQVMRDDSRAVEIEL